MLVLFCLLVLVSFTHGYLPYGSSDILLPSLVAFGWTVEFAPRYGGATDPAEVDEQAWLVGSVDR